MGRALKVGEIRVGQGLGGLRTFERVDEHGQVEQGLLAPANAPIGPHVAGIVEMGPELDEPGVRQVKRLHKFTARGPSQVSSQAYRNGWDRAFGSKPN